MDRNEFFEIADSFRSPHLWKKVETGWQLRNRVQDNSKESEI